MQQVILNRFESDDQGTLGILSSNDGFVCKTLELPWRDNQHDISCIPIGEYESEMIVSKKYGNVYWLKKVSNRSGILIHSGNLAGDESRGFKTHSAGCILLGKYFGKLGGQKAVLASRIIVNKFKDFMNGDNFKLIIKNNEVSENV